MLLSATASARRRPVAFTRQVIVNIIGTASAPSFPGGAPTFSGLNKTDTVRIDKVAGMTYQAFSPFPSDDYPAANGKPWTNSFYVRLDDGSDLLCNTPGQPFATAQQAEAAMIANPVVLTGSTSYTLWLYDTIPSDDRGGLSVRVTVS
jgi:hypothetical protein